MNRRLNLKYNKIVMSALVVACSLGAVTPVNYLQATTISQTANNTKSITVKDTTITFGALSQDPETKEPIVSATIERVSGFPADTTNIMISGTSTATVNGKKCEFSMVAKSFKKVSDTKANVQILISKHGQAMRDHFKLADIKGHTLNIKMDEVRYEMELTKLSEAFKAQLKAATAIQGVTGEEAGIGYMNKGGSFIPSKGLNIPVMEGSQAILLDNIGFVDGKFELRISTPNKDFCMVDFSDSKDKHIFGTGIGLKDSKGEIHIYESIKDLATLNKCKVNASASVVLDSDKEEKTSTMTF